MALLKDMCGVVWSGTSLDILRNLGKAITPAHQLLALWCVCFALSRSASFFAHMCLTKLFCVLNHVHPPPPTWNSPETQSIQKAFIVC